MDNLVTDIKYQFQEQLFVGGQVQWATVGLLFFALAFFVVGVMRVVEFDGVGIRGLKKWGMIAAHFLGCLSFSTAIVVAAMDTAGLHKVTMNILFFGALALLFPGQIFVAFKRRPRTERSID